MSVDKYPSILLLKMEAIVYLFTVYISPFSNILGVFLYFHFMKYLIREAFD